MAGGGNRQTQRSRRLKRWSLDLRIGFCCEAVLSACVRAAVAVQVAAAACRAPSCADFCGFHLIRYRFFRDTDGEKEREQSDGGSALRRTVQLESLSNNLTCCSPAAAEEPPGGAAAPPAGHLEMLQRDELTKALQAAALFFLRLILLSGVHQDALTVTVSAWD